MISLEHSDKQLSLSATHFRVMFNEEHPRYFCCVKWCRMHITTGTLVLVTINIILAVGSFFSSGVVPLHTMKAARPVTVPPLLRPQTADVLSGMFPSRSQTGMRQTDSQAGRQTNSQQRLDFVPRTYPQSNNPDYPHVVVVENGRKRSTRQTNLTPTRFYQEAKDTVAHALAQANLAGAASSGVPLATGVITLITGGLTLAAIIKIVPMYMIPLLTQQVATVIFLGVSSIAAWIAMIVLAATSSSTATAIAAVSAIVLTILTVLQVMIYRIYRMCYDYLSEKRVYNSDMYVSDSGKVVLVEENGKGKEIPVTVKHHYTRS